VLQTRRPQRELLRVSQTGTEHGMLNTASLGDGSASTDRALDRCVESRMDNNAANDAPKAFMDISKSS